MSPEDITDLIRYTIFVTAEISAPMLFVLMTLGLTIAVFQSVTQISETTLVFIPKLIAFSLTVTFAFPWMMKMMLRYTYEIFVFHWNTVVNSATYAL